MDQVFLIRFSKNFCDFFSSVFPKHFELKIEQGSQTPEGLNRFANHRGVGSNGFLDPSGL